MINKFFPFKGVHESGIQTVIANDNDIWQIGLAATTAKTALMDGTTVRGWTFTKIEDSEQDDLEDFEDFEDLDDLEEL